MICPKCGAENREEALFCGDCGHRIQRLTPKQKWILIGVLSIFTIIFLGIKISNHINFTNSLEQGESALKSGKFQEALDFCKTAVDLKPENEKAKACLKKATENLINSFISTGKELMSAGKYDQAFEYFQKALNLGGGLEVEKLLNIAKAKKIEAEANAKARTEAINKGKKLMSDGKYEQALKYFQKALELGGGPEVKKLLDTAKAKAINRAINGPYKEMSWDDAVKYCKELGLRLPTVNELKRMYESECTGKKRGTGCSKGFWSSEKYGDYTSYWGNQDYWGKTMSSEKYGDYTSRAMFVHFGYGIVLNNFKTTNYYVRCVQAR